MKKFEAEIRVCLLAKEMGKAIAKKYSVHPTHVQRIKTAMRDEGSLVSGSSRCSSVAADKQLHWSVSGWKARLEDLKAQKIKEGKQTHDSYYNYS